MNQVLVFLGSIALFFYHQAETVVGGDSGDMVTAAITFGVAHPPGYPIFTLFGWLTSLMPISTPAWRVGLVSSIPHAIVIVFVFSLAFQITKKRWIAMFVSLYLASNYLFFLYSVTSEVFALFDLFVVLLVYLLFRFMQKKRIRWFYVSAFVFGLSLTHHHMILFMVPAFTYILWTKRKIFQAASFAKVSIISMLVFFLGLLPYLTVFIAARGGSMINWDWPTDWSQFVRLVTRADYGTFQSGGVYGTLMKQRFLQIVVYARFIHLDFTWFGIGLLAIGMYGLWKRARTYFWFFTIAIFSIGPLFFFYASFPLANRFTFGTYERFLLPSYTMFALIFASGLREVSNWGKHTLTKYMGKKSVVFYWCFVAILFVYPLTQLGVTMWKFYGLPEDRTAEHLGYDLLSPLPQGSILLLGADTPLFSAQYVRYGLGFRPDIALLHASRLGFDDYQKLTHKNFPHLTITTDESGSAIIPLVQSYGHMYPIFSNALLPAGKDWYWVPHGLLYRLVYKDELPTPEALLAINRALWSTYHSPEGGILSRYNHLMLASVRDVYAEAHIYLAKILIRAGLFSEAKKELVQALGYGDTESASSAYTYMGLAALFENNCTEAIDSFQKAKMSTIIPDKILTFYLGITYRDCQGDATRAKDLLDEFESLVKQEETQLPK